MSGTIADGVRPLDDYWDHMVTVALLGTDRREPPSPPPGGLADLAADDPLPTASQRLLQQVAACTTVRRAGVLPALPAPSIAAPDDDPRPVTPPAATTTWRRLVADWPVLEDEWVLAVLAAGRRLAPELVPPVLGRHRTDVVRHERALLAAGPLGAWMVGWSPRLACTGRRPAAGLEFAVQHLPELPIVPELLSLLDASGDDVARVVATGLAQARFTAVHRAVLVNLVARVQPAALAPLAAALDRVDPLSPSIGLAYALAELAHLRRHMLTELEPA